MARYASEIVKQAQSWVGRKEGSNGHKEIIDIYNSHKPLARGYKVKYTDAWCMPFVAAVAIRLGYTDIIPTECSCGRMIELCKEARIWVENENRTPNMGEIIFYDWDDTGKGDNKGWPEHVGIVEKVENGKITVIEGNHDGSDADKIDGVERRTIVVNAKTIRGYAVPKYDAEPKKEELTATKPANSQYKPGIYQVAVGSLNRRKGPGANYDRAGSALAKGDKLNVTKIENEEWGYAENLKAWVNISDDYCKYLGAAVVEEPKDKPKKEPAVGDLIKVSGNIYSNKNGGKATKVNRDLYITKIYSTGAYPYALSKTKGGTTYGYGNKEVLS